MLDPSQIELAFCISSFISTVFSSTVLLTAIVFPVMRKRLFMQLIMFISISDVIAGSAAAIGFPLNHSAACYAQSFLVNMFYKSSWFWTVALTHQLYYIFMFGKFGFKMMYMHMICWPLAFALTLIPLSTTPFGRDDDGPALGWCFLDGKDSIALVWTFLSIYIPLLLSIIALTFFYVRIHLKFKEIDMRANYPEVHTVIDAIQWYPLGLIITWGPNLIVSLIANFQIFGGDTFNIIFNSVTILATQNGTFITIIFFIKSVEARYRWYYLFQYAYTRVLCCNADYYQDQNRSEESNQLEGPCSPSVESPLLQPSSLRNSESQDAAMSSSQGLSENSHAGSSRRFYHSYNLFSSDKSEDEDSRFDFHGHENLSFRHLWETPDINTRTVFGYIDSVSSTGTSRAQSTVIEGDLANGATRKPLRNNSKTPEPT